jgi:NitT/TauT family transport system substrate-binding protein
MALSWGHQAQREECPMRSFRFVKAGILTSLTALLATATVALGASASPAASMLGEPETTAFRVGYGGVGISTVPMLAAIDRLNESGWNIEGVEISAPELLVQGVASNELQVARGSTPAAAAAAALGAPVKIVVAPVRNEWTLYSVSSLAGCPDLAGQRLAIHSEGSVSTFMVRSWLADQCPGTEPEYLIVPGSENRFAALLADQIEASPIELADAVALEAEGGDKFHRLTSFAETLPFLETELEANTDWAAANPNAVAAFIAAILEENRKFTSDAGYFREQVLKYLPGVNEATLDAVIEAYQALDIMSSDGGIEADKQNAAINFMVQYGLLQPGLLPDRLYDRTYLDAALSSLPS